MSLFGNALALGIGGAGAAVQTITSKYIDDDLKRQTAVALQDQQQAGERGLQGQRQAGAMTLADHQASIQRDRDAFVNMLQTQQYKDKANFDNSPEQMAADANRTASQTKAKNDNTVRELTPGTQLFDGQGRMVGQNARPTGAEVTDSLTREGWKGSGSGGGGTDKQQAALDAKKKAEDQKEFYNLNLPKNYTGEDGKVDTQRWDAVTSMGSKAMDQDPNLSPVKASAKAQALYDKAHDFAGTVVVDTHLLGKDTVNPDKQKALTAKVVANVMGGMPVDKAFDPKTYDGSAPAKIKPAAVPSSSGSPAPSSAAATGSRDPVKMASAPMDAAEIPTQPPEMLANPIRPNPAYADWMNRYGGAIAAQRDATTQRNLSLMDRMRAQTQGRSYPAGSF